MSASSEILDAPYDLLALYKDPIFNRLTGFCDLTNQLDVQELIAAYHRLLDGAPKRHGEGKEYFVGHSGYPKSVGESNRREEHLAIALWNADQGAKTMLMPGGGNLNLVDYQFPLYAKQGDTGVGKVDLFGVIDGIQPCVIELKIQPSRDTPLMAFLEAFAYCAIVEANADEIAKEACEKFGFHFTERRPAIIVMAPSEYWERYATHPKAGLWWPALRLLADRLYASLGLRSYFIGLCDATFTMGTREQKPLITGDCSIFNLESLPGLRE